MTRFKSSTFVQYLATAVAVIASAQLASAADEGAKVGGFVDAGFTISNPSGRDPLVVQDGALYFSHKAGSSMFMLDLPFSSYPGESSITPGLGKAQAYVKHSYSSGFSWRLGQFDGIFGLERNDTVDLFFARQGALYNRSQPATNAGVEVAYSLGDSLGLQAYASGENDNGNNEIGSRPEFGAKVAYTGGLNVGLGGYYRKVSATAKALYGNLTVDTKIGDAGVGVEGSYYKAGEGEAQIGFGGNATFGLTDSIEAGVRGQYLSKFVAHQETELTAGLRFKMDKNLNVKVNYVFDI